MEQESGTQGLRAQTSTKMPDASEDDDVRDSKPEKASSPAKNHEQVDGHGGGFLDPRTNVAVLEPSEPDKSNVE